ncbi:MAG: 3-phenylpropionate/trans-cinnamate dioxygenase ferredoxin reductase component [Actinomycetota bacterium]|nr:3-phenylpropionate/trans-cinnamate dioxygenase ferredoxin reductase component [Actinomycetota bacterium]
MEQVPHFVIVGASLAGATAAAALRTEGFDGDITLLGSESHHPYERPPLSKDYLQGKADRSSVFVFPDDRYIHDRIDFRANTTAVDLDTGNHELTLDSGQKLGYDKLLLATGSSPRILTVPGADLAGVHYLRTLDDSEALREKLSTGGQRVVLIGSGWIGMELAASARMLGNDVVVLERGAIPLSGALGDELGTMFADLHKANGVDIRPSSQVVGIVGENGRVTGVTVSGEAVIAADLVVVGIGATPNTQLATPGDLEVDDGVLVSDTLQTSDPDVFAAGDIANILHPVIQRRVRSEHWQNAIWTGEFVAKTMLGQQAKFDRIPYFYTDQFDLGMEYSGYGILAKDARLVYRGNREAREFVVFWLTRDDRVVAGMNVNVWDVNEQVQRLIRDARPVDQAALSDPGVPLDTL